MAQFVTMLAVGKWNDRANLAYVPVNEKINGRRYNAFGVAISAAGDPAETRRPYRMEEADSVSYIMYDDDSRVDVPIYRIQEV